jgi:L-cysteine desulfidase
MDTSLYQAYVEILREELIPAMGCTEPIAVAYAAAIARSTLGTLPEKAEVCVSGNIIKNVKSVIVPNTSGLKGLQAAAAVGMVAGDPDAELQVISKVTPEQIRETAEYLEKQAITIRKSDSGFIFDIGITAEGGGHTAYCRIVGNHTNVVSIKKDGAVILDKPCSEGEGAHKTDRSLLTVEQIVEFADSLQTADVKDIIGRQIEYNMAIAEEGLKSGYGARIGKTLIAAYGGSVWVRAKAMAAAGSDARMNGCEMPVVINSGSGNQGITASVPVIVYARELGVSEELLFRALAVSNLVTIHLKTGIGSLSAYCGSTSAGCGAGAGITYLYGGRYNEIAHTIVNAVAINSGMICDGAKASCAAKIASAVEAGLLGMQMYMHGNEFYGGDGIVTKGVENTINNVGKLARDGMSQTDQEIINIMIEK